jgi:hypothetical protein
MRTPSKESSWLVLRDAVGAVISSLAPVAAKNEGPSREKRCKE